MVEGKLISVGKNEVYVDLEGYGVGVVRGRELYDDEATLSALKPGDQIFVSVVDPENKEGIVELSLRQAGQERVWQTLKEKMDSREVVRTKIVQIRAQLRHRPFGRGKAAGRPTSSSALRPI